MGHHVKVTSLQVGDFILTRQPVLKDRDGYACSQVTRIMMEEYAVVLDVVDYRRLILPARNPDYEDPEIHYTRPYVQEWSRGSCSDFRLPSNAKILKIDKPSEPDVWEFPPIANR